VVCSTSRNLILSVFYVSISSHFRYYFGLLFCKISNSSSRILILGVSFFHIFTVVASIFFFFPQNLELQEAMQLVSGCPFFVNFVPFPILFLSVLSLNFVLRHSRLVFECPRLDKFSPIAFLFLHLFFKLSSCSRINPTLSVYFQVTFWSLLLSFVAFFPKISSCSSRISILRVEFLLKTDSGYPRDAEVTLFTLANPEHSLRFNTHWSAPPVYALARSGRPTVASREIETTVFDPASQFLSNISRRA